MRLAIAVGFSLLSAVRQLESLAIVTAIRFCRLRSRFIKPDVELSDVTSFCS